MNRFLRISFALILLFSIFVGASNQQPAHGDYIPPMKVEAEKTGYDLSGQAATDEAPADVAGPTRNDILPPSGSVTLGSWRNLRPTESYLRDVSMLPADMAANVNCSAPDQQSKGWIVGDFGVILAYCHGIWDHAITTESIPTDLYGVAAVNPTLAFAVGKNGTIQMYGWDRVAQNYVWVKLPIQVSNQTLNRISIVPTGADTYMAWAVGDRDPNLNRATIVRGDIYPDVDSNGHKIYKSNWFNLTSTYGSLPTTTNPYSGYWGVQVLTPNDAWAVESVVDQWKGYAIHWNGSTWSSMLVGNDPLYGVHFRNSTDGYAVGENGGIYHYNGSGWSKVTSPVNSPLADVSYDAATNTWWANGFDGKLLKSTAGGAWSVFTDLRTDPFDFYAMDHTSGHGWLVGFNDNKGVGGHILEYAENAWLSVTVPTDNSLNDVAVLSDVDAWAVGASDALGATIVHFDGRHWQRYFQKDLPIPPGDLYTIDMLSPTYGWTAGEPPSVAAPANFLYWDGRRWSPPRYQAPLNVRVNDLKLIDSGLYGGPFGWASAISGNAVAKYDLGNDFWSANHTCGGYYYNLRGLSLIPSQSFLGENRDWDAWAVGESSAGYETFMRYLGGCGGGLAWQEMPYDYPSACPNPDGSVPPDGPWKTDLWSIRAIPPNTDFPYLGGYASGNYNQRATIYEYDGNNWNLIYCQPADVANPSQFTSTDVFEDTHVAWFGGYYTIIGANNVQYKVALVSYIDSLGYQWGSNPFPLNGRNIFHRPISRLEMSSETMGWAVGERENGSKIGTIYQYPYPNYTLKLTPEAGVVRPGSSTDVTASVASLGAVDTTITLSNGSPLPSGFNVQFTPTTINSSSTTNIHIAVDGSVTPGTYQLSIRGSATIRSGDNDILMVRKTPLTVYVTNHPVTSVSPDHGPAGTVVNINGQNFGTVAAGQRSTASNHVELAGKQIPDANVLSWSNTQIQVRVPDSSTLYPFGPVKDFVRVTTNVSGSVMTSNSNLNFQLENFLDEGTYEVQADKNVITLTGTSFGNDPGYLSRSTYFERVTFDGATIPYWDVLSWSNHQIVFQVAATTPVAGKKVSITSNGYLSNEITMGSMSYNNAVYIPFVKR